MPYLIGEKPTQGATIRFRDGKRKIDYILAFKDTDDAEKVMDRETFQQNLVKEGLHLEHESKEYSQDGHTHFVKLHAPWDVLTRMAELMNFRMPIKEFDIQLDNMNDCLKQIPNPFEISEELIPVEKDYFTAPFSRDKEDIFIIHDKDEFFTNAQRSAMVHDLLLRAHYSSTKFGIDKLLKHGVYAAAFPLHEGPYHSEHSILTHGAINDRHLLYEVWAQLSRWYCIQPLDLVRKYFGEKIGIYFTWLGFYTTMLIPASIVGLIVFIYGCATLFNNAPSEEICDQSQAGNITMCPLCDKRCSYWRLISSCTYSRLTYLFDNYATVFFAGFMAVWATTFLEFWKRRQAELIYDWDVSEFELEEHMRPEFEAKCTRWKKNPVTQEMEPYIPLWSKIPRKGSSFVIVLFLICCVLAAVFGVIMYRMVVITLFYSAKSEIVHKNAKITTTASAAAISLVIILLLNKLYQNVAVWLTEMERPRTDSDFEDSFTFKMFLFQFINYYATLFYIAFFKGRLNGRPGAYTYSLGYRGEECDPAGCLIELCIQLGIIMVGKQALNNFKELMLPKIMNWFRLWLSKKHVEEGNLYTRWEQDYDLASPPDRPLFDEYLEMVIQYGFVTIFVAAFPLAPLFALINNVLEVRLDAYKFVTQYRRPVAQRAQDIGVWYGILKGITFIAVLTNAFIIGWTSEFIPKMVYKFRLNENHDLSGYVNHSLSYFNVSDFQPRSYPDNVKADEFGEVTICRYPDYRYPPWEDNNKYEYTRVYWHVFCARLAFVIVFEHCVFFLTWLVRLAIPDIPARIKILKLRERYLAKEARYAAAFSTLHSERAADNTDSGNTHCNV